MQTVVCSVFQTLSELGSVSWNVDSIGMARYSGMFGWNELFRLRVERSLGVLNNIPWNVGNTVMV